MKNGYRVIDMDTHVRAPAELLEKYADPDFMRDRYDELKPYHKNRSPEFFDLSVAPIPFSRIPGQPLKEEHLTPIPGGGRDKVTGTAPKNAAGLPGHHRKATRPGTACFNPGDRLLDMDDEGRDVDMMFPEAWTNGVQALNDPTLSEGVYKAYHRFLNEYCSADPNRLKTSLQLPGNDVEWSIGELKAWANEKWMAGVWLHLGPDQPIDDPGLEPLWAVMNDLDVPLVHHSFYVDWPYFPGYRDMWGTAAICRAAAHPWGASRLSGYFICSGILDRYPNLRFGFAEVGHGWLPNWALRLTEEIWYVSGVDLPTLKYPPIEYFQQGRICVAAEPMEGPIMTKAVYDVLGDQCLFHQSDYPHPQSYFPDTAEMVIDWPIWKDLGDQALRNHMGGNAARFLGSRL